MLIYYFTQLINFIYEFDFQINNLFKYLQEINFLQFLITKVIFLENHININISLIKNNMAITSCFTKIIYLINIMGETSLNFIINKQNIQFLIIKVISAVDSANIFFLDVIFNFFNNSNDLLIIVFPWERDNSHDVTENPVFIAVVLAIGLLMIYGHFFPVDPEERRKRRQKKLKEKKEKERQLRKIQRQKDYKEGFSEGYTWAFFGWAEFSPEIFDFFIEGHIDVFLYGYCIGFLAGLYDGIDKGHVESPFKNQEDFDKFDVYSHEDYNFQVPEELDIDPLLEEEDVKHLFKMLELRGYSVSRDNLEFIIEQMVENLKNGTPLTKEEIGDLVLKFSYDATYRDANLVTKFLYFIFSR